jgi:ABC-type iron transport system FetAB ATPase subunit
MEAASMYLKRLFLPEGILERDALVISVGEASRVALVRALLLRPDVLLLDEPTAALDPDSKEAAADLLREWVSSSNRGIVGVTHDESLRRLLPGHEVRL